MINYIALQFATIVFGREFERFVQKIYSVDDEGSSTDEELQDFLPEVKY